MKSSKKQKNRKNKKNNEIIKNNIIKEQNECFICFEIKYENELEPIQLKTQEYYIKKCNCNGYIHKKCLDKWCNTNNKCPICRKIIYKTPQIILTNTNQSGYLYFKKTIFILSKHIIVFTFMYFTCEFFLSLLQIINNKYYYITDIIIY